MALEVSEAQLPYALPHICYALVFLNALVNGMARGIPLLFLGEAVSLVNLKVNQVVITSG